MKVKIRKSNVKQRKTGFLARMKTKSGRKLIARQRREGRWRLGTQKRKRK
ncbi:MAG: 50S ribosomal protein L34 [Planctomycetota bacterium]|nr:50S ribosomal protein L34 [Planctomycetota bacterium]